MDNLGLHIYETQNQSTQVDQLAAQRKIYSIAKRIKFCRLFLVTLLPIVIAIFFTNESNVYWVFPLYTISVTILDQILEIRIDKLKAIAASVQEKFDLAVFNLKENNFLKTESVDAELIRKYSKNTPADQKKLLKDWYPIEIQSLRSNIAILLCQRTNIAYDFSIREKYTKSLYFFAVLVFFTLLMFSLENSFSLLSFIVSVLLPLLPLFTYIFKEHKNGVESLHNLLILKSIIDPKIDSLNSDSNKRIGFIRSVQDRIFENRRVSPLIPDIYYKFVRVQHEDQMHYSIEEKIKKLKEE